MTDDLLRAREVLLAEINPREAEYVRCREGDYTFKVSDREAVRAMLAFATPRPVETREVIQADRDAAADWYDDQDDAEYEILAANIRSGNLEPYFGPNLLVQAFKNHRLAFASPTPEPSSDAELPDDQAAALYDRIHLEELGKGGRLGAIRLRVVRRFIAEERTALASLDAGSASS